MCCQIGQIYHGRSYSWHAARIAAGVIGIMSFFGQMMVLEAFNVTPLVGWLVKGQISAGVIKQMGEQVVRYYETHPA